MKHTIAIAALVATSIGFAVVPAYAQESATPVAARADRQVHRVVRDGGIGRGAGILGLVCSDRGAEMLEVSLVRLSHRLELTAAQKTLFEDFRTKALTTQTSLTDACRDAMPEQTAETRPDLLDRLKSGLAVEQARLAAMTAVLPEFEAFYGSLTDAQKADLMPRRAQRPHLDDRDGGRPDRNGPHRMHRLPAPGRG